MRKNTAKVIAITGTVGKSSTKEAIFTVLKSHYSVRANYGSLNNELGLPLAIFGQRNGTNVYTDYYNGTVYYGEAYSMISNVYDWAGF